MAYPKKTYKLVTSWRHEMLWTARIENKLTVINMNSHAHDKYDHSIPKEMTKMHDPLRINYFSEIMK